MGNTIKIECEGSHTESIDNLVPFQGELKSLSKENYERLREKILTQGFSMPIAMWRHEENNYILDGHQRLRTLKRMRDEGFEIPQIPIVAVKAHTFQQAKEKLLAFTSQFGEIQLQGLRDFAAEASIGLDKVLGDFHFPGVDMKEFELKFVHGSGEGDGSGGSGGEGGGDRPGALAERFVVPPFSTMDTRQGYWRDRKKKWMDEIKDKGESREGTLSKHGDNIVAGINNGVSILDPVLAEACLKWFALQNCNVFDPFAGDTVFGYVAKKLGHNFIGIELREEQAKLNQERVDCIDAEGKKPGSAVYKNDSSENINQYIKDGTMDFLFSCPPYYDLEVYSDDERDLSNQETYEDFLKLIGGILKKSAKKLKKNRFAVITIGEIRDKNGAYCGLVPDIIGIMREAGLHFYNEIILLNAIGTAHMRAGRYMQQRKVPKLHQNVLVFFKGDMKKIKDTYPTIECEYEETGKELDGTLTEEELAELQENAGVLSGAASEEEIKQAVAARKEEQKTGDGKAT